MSTTFRRDPPRSPLGVRVAAITIGRSALLRSLLLGAATAAGKVNRWLVSGWRPLLAVYVLSGVLLAIHHLLNEPDPLRRLQHAWGSPEHVLASVLIWFFHGAAGPWLVAFGISALIAILIAAFRARKTVVILPFANVTGDDKNKPITDGLARRLMTEISEIADIFATVRNEPPEFTYGEKPHEAPKLVVDGGADAFSAVKASLAGSKVQVGIVNLPLDTVFNLLSTLVRGPRMIGSLQITDAGLLLEVSLEQDSATTAWRVTSEDAGIVDDKASSPDAIPAIVRQMAFRIFTHVQQNQLGTPVWRAVQCYTTALRASRDASRDKQRQLVYLRRAQRAFFDAYREDQQFIRTLYNLGVICYSQQEFIAAYEIFRDVEDKLASPASSFFGGDSRSKRAAVAGLHYASAKAAQGAMQAAQNAVDANQRAARDWKSLLTAHCYRALDLLPEHALAWNLLGVLSFKIEDPGESRYYFRRAASLAWWDLSKRRFRTSRPVSSIHAANLTLVNLATTNFDRAAGTREIRQAIRLDPGHPENELLRGQIWLHSNKPKQALYAFERASAMRERSDIWFWTSIAQALLGKEEEAKEYFRRAIENPEFNAPAELTTLQRVCPKISGLSARFASEELGWLQNEVRQQKDESKLDQLAAPSEQDSWQAAQACLRLAQIAAQNFTQANNPVDRSAFLKTAIARFEEARHLLGRRVMVCAPQLAVMLLSTRISECWQSRAPDPAKLDEIVRATGEALRQCPIGANERYLLAQSLLLLGLDDPALDEVSNSLIINPTLRDSLLTIVQTAMRRFAAITDPEYRRSSIEQAVNVLRDLAEVEESKIWDLDRQFIGYVHTWLGNLSYELLDFKSAQSSLETAIACLYLPFTNLSDLCVIHFRTGAYEEAERAYQRVHYLADPSIVSQAAACEADPRIEVWLAWVANHTAAARAEQGSSAHLAMERWLEGRRKQRTLTWLTNDQRRGFSAAQLLALGCILLGDATNVAGRWSRSTRTSSGDPSQAANVKTERKCRRLRSAIVCFQRAITANIDSAVRADALYRMALAYASLADSDPANADSWKAQASDALDKTAAADRRLEYKTRIATLRAKLPTRGMVLKPESRETAAHLSPDKGTPAH